MNPFKNGHCWQLCVHRSVETWKCREESDIYVPAVNLQMDVPSQWPLGLSQYNAQ